MAPKLFPLVSGTNKRQKRKVRPVMPPKTQKEPASLMAATRSEKNFVTMKARVQLKVVAMAEAGPRTSQENSSDIISQGIGPKPMENLVTGIPCDHDMHMAGNVRGGGCVGHEP